MNDDFKISMDDIKDMVSEYFGEKIEKVEAAEAKKLLELETKEFMEIGITEISDKQMTEDEISTDEYEADIKKTSNENPPVNVDDLRKQIETEMREKIKKK